MDAWIGPAIIAALVSASVSAMGWIVTFRATLRLEQLRRDEKVNDFQVALRAEIESDLLNLVVGERSVMLDGVARALRQTPAMSRLFHIWPRTWCLNKSCAKSMFYPARSLHP